MKVIFRNAKLEFESPKPIKVADLAGGYASKNTVSWGENWAVVLDIVNGEIGSDNAPQAIFGTSIVSDVTSIKLTKRFLASIKNGSMASIAEGLAGSRYKLAMHSSGAICLWNDGNIIETTAMVGSAQDTDIMVGCRRTTKTQPYLGKYAGIYIANNVSADSLKTFLDNPMQYANHAYLPGSIDGLTWRDSVGNIDLTLSNEAVITEVVG